MKLAVAALLGAGLLQADAISIGARAGLPLGDAFDAIREQSFTIRNHNRFLVGPTFELRLPAGFGASFDALYRRYSFDVESSQGKTTEGAGQFEFPLMVRYRFPGIVVRPFVGAGPTFQRLTGLEAIRKNTAGLVFGGGLDIKLPVLRLTPEIRWTVKFQDNRAGPGSVLLNANRNQFDLLVGFTF